MSADDTKAAAPPIAVAPGSADWADEAIRRGGYVLLDCEGEPQCLVLATGSEVEIAVKAAEALEADGIKAAVVSMPCWALFERQSPEYRAEVLGRAPRIGIEAAARFGEQAKPLQLGRHDPHRGRCGAAPEPAGEAEDAAFAGLALDRDIAIHHLDQAPRDR